MISSPSVGIAYRSISMRIGMCNYNTIGFDLLLIPTTTIYTSAIMIVNRILHPSSFTPSTVSNGLPVTLSLFNVKSGLNRNSTTMTTMKNIAILMTSLILIICSNDKIYNGYLLDPR